MKNGSQRPAAGVGVWQVLVDRFVLPLLLGLLAGAISAAGYLASQQYLQLRMWNLSAHVALTELNTAVIFSLAAYVVLAILWLLLARKRAISSRLVFAFLVPVACGAVAIYLCRGELNHLRWTVEGVNGRGTLTADYLLSRLDKYSLYMLAALGGWTLLAALSWLLFTPLRYLAARLVPAGGRLLLTVRRPVIVLAILLVAGNVAHSLHNRLNPPLGPDVVLISIDTLRADHLGCYGFPRDTSPNLDSFAAQNIRFANCYAQSPWTLTSHISMLTSLYPSMHAVNDEMPLDPQVVTLAEVLKDEGYRTLGVARSCIWMDAEYGFDQGFDVYTVRTFAEDAAVQNEFLARLLPRFRDGKRFLFLHYFDPHSDFFRLPYDSPESYRQKFCADYQGTFTGGEDGRYASEYLRYLNANRIQLAQPERDYIASLYDSGIAYFDDCLAGLFELLARHDLLEDSLVIITADHGEEFQDHGRFGHDNPYQHKELIHVPLLVKLPGGAHFRPDLQPRQEIPELVEIIDIMPTILEYLRVTPPADLQGSSFYALLAGAPQPAPDFARVAFAELGRSVSLTSGKWRLLGRDHLADDSFRLFNLQEDPQENRDVLASHPDVVAFLKAEIDLRRNGGAGNLGRGKLELSPEQINRLRSLGYLD